MLLEEGSQQQHIQRRPIRNTSCARRAQRFRHSSGTHPREHLTLAQTPGLGHKSFKCSSRPRQRQLNTSLKPTTPRTYTTATQYESRLQPQQLLYKGSTSMGTVPSSGGLELVLLPTPSVGLFGSTSATAHMSAAAAGAVPSR